MIKSARIVAAQPCVDKSTVTLYEPKFHQKTEPTPIVKLVTFMDMSYTLMVSPCSTYTN
jgi:hypothetical protein